jgi:DNA-binding XRE family transcriptional regulator
MTEYAEISFRVPVDHIDRIRLIVDNILSLIDEEERFYTLEEVFPEGIKPSTVLRGARGREELTQEQLAEMLGVEVQQIVEMENGQRPIDKEMAKRLGKALNFGYKVFL